MSCGDQEEHEGGKGAYRAHSALLHLKVSWRRLHSARRRVVSQWVSWTLVVENDGAFSSFVAPDEVLCLKCLE